MCGTIRRKLQKKTRKDTKVKLYRAMAIWIRTLKTVKSNWEST
jgi:hypothetical protein